MIAVVIAAIAAVTAAASGGNSAVTSGIGNTLLKPVKSVVTSLANTMENIYSYMYKYDQLDAENKELKAKIAEYEDNQKEFLEISEENKRLNALFGFSKDHEDFEYAPAKIISWGASNYSSTFSINKGSNADIELNDAVINENGYLIGMITEVSDVSATVTTIVDTKTNIGASLYTTNEAVIAKGDFALMPEYRLKLDCLPENANLASDDIVTTAGGGYYPQGIIIGYIEDVRISSSGLDDFAVIRPAANLKEISEIYVVTDFNN